MKCLKYLALLSLLVFFRSEVAIGIEINGQLKNALLEIQTSAPTAYQARIYYNSTSNKAQYYNGSAWLTIVDTTQALLNTLTTTGDIIYSSDNSGSPARLGIGGAHTVIHGGTTPNYAAVSLTADVSGILPPPNGGTGVSGAAVFPTVGTVVTEAGTETLTNKSMSGSANTFTNLPLASAVSGILPVPNGGTGDTSFTTNAVVVGASAAALQIVTNNSSATNEFLTQSSSGAPAWATILNADIPSTLTGKTISATANTIHNIMAEYDFTGDGSTVTFTTSQQITATSFVLAYVDGRLQKGGGSSYSVTVASPGAVVFTSAPDNGSWVNVTVVNQ